MSKISKERKVTYYIGIGMMVTGFILFISVFFSIAGSIADPDPWGFNPPPVANGIIGFILITAGAIVMSIGARGAAGSGLLLDPEKAREDLKPFSEAKGKIINDVISNIDAIDEILKPRNDHDNDVKEIIRIKCRNCGTLNDEDAAFCKKCGEEL
jgi:hypothetical protein